MKSLFLSVFIFSSCASTSFYHDGKKVVSVQGDVKDMHVRVEPNGAIEISAASMNHSNPTLAYGKSSSSRIEMIGTAIASGGLFSFIK